MTLTTTQHIEDEQGRVYDRFQISLNIFSTVPGQIMVNMRLVPVHVTQDGERIDWPEQQRTMAIPDLEAAAMQDGALAQAAMGVLGAIQGLINAKNF
jgi:hypothetical protein